MTELEELLALIASYIPFLGDTKQKLRFANDYSKLLEIRLDKLSTLFSKNEKLPQSVRKTLEGDNAKPESEKKYISIIKLKALENKKTYELTDDRHERVMFRMLLWGKNASTNGELFDPTTMKITYSENLSTYKGWSSLLKYFLERCCESDNGELSLKINKKSFWSSLLVICIVFENELIIKNMIEHYFESISNHVLHGLLEDAARLCSPELFKFLWSKMLSRSKQLPLKDWKDDNNNNLLHLLLYGFVTNNFIRSSKDFSYLINYFVHEAKISIYALNLDLEWPFSIAFKSAINTEILRNMVREQVGGSMEMYKELCDLTTNYTDEYKQLLIETRLKAEKTPNNVFEAPSIKPKTKKKHKRKSNKNHAEANNEPILSEKASIENEVDAHLLGVTAPVEDDKLDSLICCDQSFSYLSIEQGIRDEFKNTNIDDYTDLVAPGEFEPVRLKSKPKLQIEPNNKSAEQITIFINNKQFEAAINIYQSMIASVASPITADIHKKIAYAYLALRQFSHAIQICSKFVNLNAEHYKSNGFDKILADSLYGEENFEKALPIYKKIYDSCHYDLAYQDKINFCILRTYCKLDQDKESIQVLSHFHDDINKLDAIAYLYSVRANFIEANIALNTIWKNLCSLPISDDQRNKKFNCYIKVVKLYRLEEENHTALDVLKSLDPNGLNSKQQIIYFHLLAELHHDQGNINEALNCFTANKHLFSDMGFNMRYGILLRKSGYYDEAIEHFHSMFKDSNCNKEETQYQLARAYFDSGQVKEAIQIYQSQKHLYFSQLGLAYCYYQLEENDLAQSELNQLMEHEFPDRLIHYIAIYYMRAGQYGLAVQCYEKIRYLRESDIYTLNYVKALCLANIENRQLSQASQKFIMQHVNYHAEHFSWSVNGARMYLYILLLSNSDEKKMSAAIDEVIQYWPSSIALRIFEIDYFAYLYFNSKSDYHLKLLQFRLDSTTNLFPNSEIIVKKQMEIYGKSFADEKAALDLIKCTEQKFPGYKKLLNELNQLYQQYFVAPFHNTKKATVNISSSVRFFSKPSHDTTPDSVEVQNKYELN